LFSSVEQRPTPFQTENDDPVYSSSLLKLKKPSKGEVKMLTVQQARQKMQAEMRRASLQGYTKITPEFINSLQRRESRNSAQTFLE